jgi:hypothetical protein
MADYTEAPVSLAAARARAIAVFSAIVFLTAALGHRYGFLATPDFIPVLGVVAGLALLSLLFAARALFQLWTFGGEGGGNVVAGVLIALLVLSPFAVSLYRALTLPALNDISTDTDDPPILAAAAKMRTAGMNSIEPFTPERRKLQLDSYPGATGRRYGAPIGQVAEEVAGVLDDRGWTVVARPDVGSDATEITFEAVAKTFLLGFPSDVAIRLIDEGTSTYVDMRSASRYGEYDLGDNDARIEAFLADLDVEIAYLTVVIPVEPVEEPVIVEPAVPDADEPLPEEPPAAPLDRSEDPPD